MKTKFNTHAFTGALTVAFLVLLPALTGCGSSSPAKKQNQDFFTSGSRDADQRAQQRMAQSEQLTGSGEGSGEKGAKPAVKAEARTTGTNTDAGLTNGTSALTTNKPALVEGKLALYDRLGAEAGLSNIVADFLPRALEDPRVNWDRNGVKHGGFSIHAETPVKWNANPTNVALLQLHLVQFLSLATGGPSHYEGKSIASSHANLHISNAEFDATVGDLKASLDRLQIANKEQKELLAVIESTRTEIVTEH